MNLPAPYKHIDEAILQPRASRENPCYTTKFSKWASPMSVTNDRSFKLFKHQDRELKIPKSPVCEVSLHYTRTTVLDFKFGDGRRASGWWVPEGASWPWPFNTSVLADAELFGRFRGVWDLNDANRHIFKIYQNAESETFLESNSNDDCLLGIIGYKHTDGTGRICIPMAALYKTEERGEREKMLDEILVILMAVLNRKRALGVREYMAGSGDGNSSAVSASVSAF